MLEVLVSAGIFIALLGLILANYRRSNDDSILSREATLLMSRLRLAQESTAGGAVAGFCTLTNDDTKCASNAECAAIAPGSTCTVSTPSGGFGLFASCSTGSVALGDNHWPDRSSYYLFADRVQCKRDCFPLNWSEPQNWPNPPGTQFAGVDTTTDHLFSSDAYGSSGRYKGDTIAEEFRFDAKVQLVDLQLQETTTGQTHTCADGSPWKGLAQPTPSPLGLVPDSYPLQVAIHYPTPDGRSVVISDNVSKTTQASSTWKEAHFMLGLVTRPTQDCRVVRVTKDGVITQEIDADCQF